MGSLIRRYDMKRKTRVTILSVAGVALAAGFAVILFLNNVFTPSNGKRYDLENCERTENELTDKTIYWLGSSVTLGMESNNTAVADYIAARNGTKCVKEAVSGTTLIDKPYVKWFQSYDSYVTRLKTTDKFDRTAEIDAFVCQISTNDAKAENISCWGELTSADTTSAAQFDVQTTIGAMEYIVSYVTSTWHCPVYFYSGVHVDDEGLRSSDFIKGSDYRKLIEKTYELAEKWNGVEGAEVRIIDLFNDEGLNDISDADYKRYMHDAVHPYKAGYLEWWTPAFERVFLKDFGK